jgi:hypothetical protein
MPKPIKSKERRNLSKFMMMRQHGALLAEKHGRDIRIRELTKVRDDAREHAAVSGKSWDNERRALDLAESRLAIINKAITRLEKELGNAQS